MARKVTGARHDGTGLGVGPSLYEAIAKRYGGNRRARGGNGKRQGGGVPNGDLAAALDGMVAKRKAAEDLDGGDGFLEKAVGAIGGAAKKGLFGALDALDTPRAALLAFGDEIGDLVDPDGDHSFDLGTAIQKTRDNYTFGEFLNENVQQYADWDAPKFVKGAIGLTGDVLMDPLTYLAPGAKIGTMGAKGTAGNLLKASADDLARAGITREAADAAAAATLRSRTASGLSDAERIAARAVDDAGRAERGIYWNAPGTGRIGRRFKIDKAIDKVTGSRWELSKADEAGVRHTKQLQLIRSERTSRANQALMKPVAKVMNSKTVTRATEAGLNGAEPLLKVMLRSGDPEQAKNATFGLEGVAQGRLQRKKFAAEFKARADAIIHDAKKKGVDMRDLWLVAANDGPAIERITARMGDDEIVTRVRALFDDAEINANTLMRELGASDIVFGRENYTPRFLTEESREAMKAGSPSGRKGGKSSIDGRRRYGTGAGDVDEVLGEKIHAVDDLKNNPNRLSEEEQISRIFQAKLGDRVPNSKGWFMEDASQAFPLYGEVLAKRVGDEYAAALLKQRGIGVDLFSPRSRPATVAARNKAVRMAEAARRRVKQAKDLVASTSDDAVRGTERAAAEGKAARKATQGKRAEAQAAAAAVGTEESKGAMALREFAEYHSDLADDMSVTLGDYVNDATEAVNRTSTEVAARRLKGERLRAEQSEVSGRLSGLVERRRVLYEQLSTAWEVAHDRLGTVEHLRGVEGEIDRLTQEIAATNDLLDETIGGVRKSRRKPETVQAELDALRTKGQRNGGRLPSLRRKAADGDQAAAREVAALERELETDRVYRKALRLEQSTGRRVDAETAELIGMGEADIARAKRSLGELRQVAEELGRDDLAMTFGLLDERLPVVDPNAERLVSPNGERTWMHGTPAKNGLDLGAGPKGAGSGRMSDSMIGPNFTDDRQVAREYAAGGGGGLASEGDGVGKVAEVELNIQNPKVFPKEIDPEWVDARTDDPWVMWKYGTSLGQAKIEMIDDFYSTGIRAGALSPDDFHDGLLDLFGAQRLDDEDVERLWEVTQDVFDDVAAGMTYREALAENFSYGEFDPLSWADERRAWSEAAHGDATDLDLVSPERFVEQRAGGEGEFGGMPYQTADDITSQGGRLPTDERVGNYMAEKLDFAISPEARQAQIDHWKQTHSQYDGVVHSYGRGTGSYVAIPFDDAQVVRTGPKTAMTDLYDIRQQKSDLITKAARAKQQAAWDMDNLIGDVELSLEDVAQRANENDQMVARLEAKLASQRAQVSAKTRDLFTQELAFRRRASELYAEADRVQQEFVQDQMLKVAQLGDEAAALGRQEAQLAVHNQRQLAVLEAQHLTAQAELAKFTKAEDKWVQKIADLDASEAGDVIRQAMADGMKKFGTTSLLPGDMVEALTAATRMQEPGFLRGALRAFDYVQNLWKGFATTSPGFLVRNTFGGVWNNFLGDVERASYQHYLAAMKGKAPAEWQAAFDAAQKAGILTGGQAAGEVMSRRGHVGFGKRINPARPEFAPVAGVRRGSESVENFLRGSMFMDTFIKTGGDVGASVEKVMKFHFDYDDLSKLERSVMRRVVPFYTWTRKNLPLQLEMIARKPQKFNRYTQLKNEVESMSEEEGVVPGFFGDNMAMRLPFTKNGGNMYYFPDLPFTGLSDFADPGMVMGMTSPFIRTPLELWAGKQAWNDVPFTDKQIEVPPLIRGIPMMMGALEGVGWASRNAEGNWVMKDRHLYALTNWVPTFGQARRLMPSETKYQENLLTTWLSFAGAGLRTNSTAVKRGIFWGEYYKLEDALKTAEAKGFIEDQKAAYMKAKYGESDPNDLGAPVDASANLLDKYSLAG